jgi:hypothetical protein
MGIHSALNNSTYVGGIAHDDSVGVHVDGLVDQVLARGDVDNLFSQTIQLPFITMFHGTAAIPLADLPATCHDGHCHSSPS